jgi:ubiquinone/menaquinone biosynthesis C-methylase UbiE
VTAPKPASPAAQQRFERIAREAGYDPHDRWVGGYVDEVWNYRHLYEASDLRVSDRVVLEFGCNFGATAIVLAMLGARVTAIDPSAAYLRIARANAERYEVAHRIDFVHVGDTTHLPFASETFDLVTCNSVLEYVEARDLTRVQREIDRVVRPGGIIVVSSTSNRLWPREVHVGSWFSNYVPMWVERWLRRPALHRGVSPWRVRYGFGSYENLDRSDRGHAYMEARRRRGATPAIRLINGLALACGTSLGLLTPNICVRLRKVG